MRPYLAIISDSFREALASRVLWILLVIITLVLLSLAPLGYRQRLTTEFDYQDIRDGQELVQTIQREAQASEPTPGKILWERWDEEAREALREFEESESGDGAYLAGRRRLREELNGVLDERDLYVAEAWEGRFVPASVRELVEKDADTLSEQEIKHRNRRLIEAAYASNFVARPPEEILITYLGYGIGGGLNHTKEWLELRIEQLFIPAIVNVFAGMLGVFVAILVTSPIIPRMFETGSLSLLLSKPISRSFMFLAKFLGGCAFALINAAYLIVGLWLIAGTRFGIWNQGLLQCILVFGFLFAIYYSVSALAGVIWRNAIVSVVMTIVFWFACTIVATSKNVLEQFAINPAKIIQVVETEDELFVVSEQAEVRRWNEDTGEWSTIMYGFGGPMGGGKIIGPVYDTANERMLAGRTNAFFPQNVTLLIANQADEWQEEEGMQLPNYTFELLAAPDGRILAVAEEGVFALNDAGAVDDRQDLELNLPGRSFRIPFGGGDSEPYVQQSPDMAWVAPSDGALDRESGRLAVYSRGTLMVLELDDDDRYTEGPSVDLVEDKDAPAAVAFHGNTILVALDDGRLLDLDAETLEVRREHRPERKAPPRYLRVTPDGNTFAVLYHSGNAYVMDAGAAPDERRFRRPRITGQGRLSAFDFSRDSHALAADRISRVSKYTTEGWDAEKRWSPPLETLQVVYRYAVVPLYSVFPRPGELGNTIQYLLTGKETMAQGGPGPASQDLSQSHVKLRPWSPIRSSLVFLVVILGLSCFYISRQDF